MPLPEPDFVERDASQILRECIEQYEAATQRTLGPTDVERLIIDLLVYREHLARLASQEAAKQTLLSYSRFPMTDYIGELVGAPRLDAQPATTTLRWTLRAVSGVATPLAQGVRARTKDGKVTFATDELVEVPAGELTVDVAATATEAGPVGNGYIPGQVAVIVDELPLFASVENTTTTADGTAIEDEDRYKERIRQAPKSFSVAGPSGAYWFFAVSAHQDIADASVTRPTAGTVRVTVLAKTGAPSGAILDAVTAALNDEDVRPICDTVEVVAATPVDYAITARIKAKTSSLGAGLTSDALVAAAMAAAEGYRDDRASRLGRDVVPSQLQALMMVDGAYSIELDDPTFIDVGPEQWARCTAISVTYDGAGDE
jgi:phage-related baseplate assembly protein